MKTLALNSIYLTLDPLINLLRRGRPVYKRPTATTSAPRNQNSTQPNSGDFTVKYEVINSKVSECQKRGTFDLQESYGFGTTLKIGKTYNLSWSYRKRWFGLLGYNYNFIDIFKSEVGYNVFADNYRDRFNKNPVMTLGSKFETVSWSCYSVFAPDAFIAVVAAYFKEMLFDMEITKLLSSK